MILFTATVLSLPGGGSLAAQPFTMAVADFDYRDTSGEIEDQVEAHRARVAAFGQLLRDSLPAEGKYRVVRLDCPDGGACTAASMRPDDFLAHARRSGARLVVYGGIRKISTLVQWGQVQVLDLQRNELLLRRTVRRYRHSVPPRGCHALKQQRTTSHVHQGSEAFVQGICTEAPITVAA